MRKHETRVHKRIGDKVVSVYFTTRHTTRFTMSTGSYTCYDYQYTWFGACVSKSRRRNNDWYDGSKNSTLINRCTGDIKTITHIYDTVSEYVLNKVLIKGYLFIKFNGSDSKRCITYLMMYRRFMKAHSELECTIQEQEGEGYYVLVCTK